MKPLRGSIVLVRLQSVCGGFGRAFRILIAVLVCLKSGAAHGQELSLPAYLEPSESPPDCPSCLVVAEGTTTLTWDVAFDGAGQVTSFTPATVSFPAGAKVSGVMLTSLGGAGYVINRIGLDHQGVFGDLDFRGLSVVFWNGLDAAGRWDLRPALTIVSSSGGNLTASVSVSWKVYGSPPPDYAIIATPSSIRSIQGNSALFSVALNAKNGFNKSVFVSYQGLGMPTGAYCSVPNVLSTSAPQSDADCTSSASTPPGTYVVTLEGNLQGWTPATSMARTTQLTWTVTPCPGLVCGRCIDPATDVKNCGACGNVCPGTANGSPVCSAGVCGVACAAGYSLISGACIAPPSLPVSNFQVTGASPSSMRLSWNAFPGATSYSIRRSPFSTVFRDAAWSGSAVWTSQIGSPDSWPAIHFSGPTESAYTDAGLQPRTYYWYAISACNAAGCSTRLNNGVGRTLDPVCTTSTDYRDPFMCDKYCGTYCGVDEYPDTLTYCIDGAAERARCCCQY